MIPIHRPRRGHTVCEIALLVVIDGFPVMVRGSLRRFSRPDSVNFFVGGSSRFRTENALLGIWIPVENPLGVFSAFGRPWEPLWGPFGSLWVPFEGSGCILTKPFSIY